MATASLKAIVRVIGEVTKVAPRSAALCAIAAAMGWSANRLRAEPISLAKYQAPTECSEASATPTASVMSAKAVSTLCGRDDVLFADARDASQFEQGHVTGAVHLACTSSRGDVGQLLGQLGGKHTLVVYGNQRTKPTRSQTAFCDKPSVAIWQSSFWTAGSPLGAIPG